MDKSSNRNRHTEPVMIAVLLLMGSAWAPIMRAQDTVVTELRIPTRSSGKKGLEAVMVRPNDNAAHPLALVTHGTPRDPTDREEMTPLRFIPQAREFARRGWTAVVLLRRGYGDSGGGYSEDGHACSQFPNYEGATKESVKDLREATTYLQMRPEVDATKMISVGISTGGLAMVGLAADPPKGLVAAINFAGGRGSNSPDHVCNAEALVETFGDFGKHAKVPMLWVYAVNDHYFGPQLAQAFYQAYTKNGGKAKFVAAGAFGEDGHGLFSLRGIPVWTPMVDDFLKSENLVLRDTLLEVMVPSVEVPAYLSSGGREAFQRYLLSPPHKAFAASSAGGVGLNFGQRTAQEAQKHAMESCRKSAPTGDPCKIVMVEDERAAN